MNTPIRTRLTSDQQALVLELLSNTQVEGDFAANVIDKLDEALVGSVFSSYSSVELSEWSHEIRKEIYAFEPQACGECCGSGEGRFEGTKCYACGGSGERLTGREVQV